MEHGITRREMIQASALLLGGVCSCRMAGDATAPRSTCCNTPDLEAESLTVNEDHLTIDLKKAASLREVGSAAWITDEGKGLKLIVVHADAKSEYCVLSRLCTHGGQTISYNHQAGPAPVQQLQPLEFRTRRRGGEGARRDAPEVVSRQARQRYPGGRALKRCNMIRNGRDDACVARTMVCLAFVCVLASCASAPRVSTRTWDNPKDGMQFVWVPAGSFTAEVPVESKDPNDAGKTSPQSIVVRAGLLARPD